MWIAVRQRFRALHQDLNLSVEQIEDGYGKARRVTQALERAYNGSVAETPPMFVVGSWGKGTQVRPSTDIDVMVEFHPKVYQRFEQRSGNKQSALLQEVRGHLSDPYPQTDIRGDGQVVAIGFNTITVEIIPVFSVPNDQYLMADTNVGGRWKLVDPAAQIRLLQESDSRTNGNTRAIAKMIKLWAREQAVPLKSFLVELLPIEFLNQYFFARNSYFYYDWIVRDFFTYLRTRSGGSIFVPGTNDIVKLGTDWAYKAERAAKAAEAACELERTDQVVAAGQEWQKIFGTRIPIYVF